MSIFGLSKKLCNESQKKKYSETYLKFGFTFTINNGLDIPVCVLSEKLLGNDSMKPSLLTRHLEKAHPKFKDKKLDFFKHRESVFKKHCLDKAVMFFQQTNTSLKASYEVSLMIAKQKKAHTIGENLVLPAAKVMVRCVFEDKSVKNLTLSPCLIIQSNEELRKCQWIFCSK